MEYDIFKSLKVKEDELHLNTKSQFCINLINKLNGEICDQNSVNKFLNINHNFKNNKKKKGNHFGSLFANDKKNLDMKTRLKYLLFPEDYEYSYDEGLDTIESVEKTKRLSKRKKRHERVSTKKTFSTDENTGSDSSSNKYIKYDDQFNLNDKSFHKQANDLKLPLISINGSSIFDKNLNNSIITNSVLPTKGMESILNTEIFSKRQRNKKISFSDYVNLNSLSSEISNINNNNNNQNKVYDNHIIYEDDYLIEKYNSIKNSRNSKSSLSPKNNLYSINNGNKNKNPNPILNSKPYIQNSPNYKNNLSSFSPRVNKFQTPMKSGNNSQILNKIEKNYYALSEKPNKIVLPKLFMNQNYFLEKSKKNIKLNYK